MQGHAKRPQFRINYAADVSLRKRSVLFTEDGSEDLQVADDLLSTILAGIEMHHKSDAVYLDTEGESAWSVVVSGVVNGKLFSANVVYLVWSTYLGLEHIEDNYVPEFCIASINLVLGFRNWKPVPLMRLVV